MRADRLLSMLLLLQTRGRMTAQALAAELEISERTVYRDIEALGAAGVPVYAERGPGGGCALLEGYRTSLTGLTEAEARALFMHTLSQPASLSELGVSTELKSALLKLSAALSRTNRKGEEEVRQRIYLDWEGWSTRAAPTPYLQTIQAGVWQDRKLRLVCWPWYGLRVEVEVAPYGLVAKSGEWQLVCVRHDRLRVYRVAELLEVHLLPETFVRPPDFDLGRFWREWCAGVAAEQTTYPVTARVQPGLFPVLIQRWGEPLRAALAQTRPEADGWVTLTLEFENLFAARDRLLSWGGAVEVLAPEPLRLSLVDFARQIVARYALTDGGR